MIAPNEQPEEELTVDELKQQLNGAMRAHRRLTELHLQLTQTHVRFLGTFFAVLDMEGREITVPKHVLEAFAMPRTKHWRTESETHLDGSVTIRLVRNRGKEDDGRSVIQRV